MSKKNSTKQAPVNQVEISRHSPSIQILIWAIVLMALIYGLSQAISLAWVGDDAFISFRYAKNLIDGHGLVFNLGERVEGYTNFLWTMLIALGMYFGAEPIMLSYVLGIMSFLFCILILLFLSIRFSESSFAPKPFIVPVAALMLMVQYDFHIYATSGLETAMTTMLVTLGFAVLLLAESKKGLLLAGLILVLAALTRPDAMIFYVMALPYIFLTAKRKINILYYLAPLIIIYAPYWLWRYWYYGWVFPNTYYAKSADLSNFPQGERYFKLYFETYYAFYLLIPTLPVSMYMIFRRFLKGRMFEHHPDRIGLLSVLFILPYMFYVIRTGGDFMFARFFIPITPICFYFLEVTILSLPRKAWLRIGVALILVASVMIRWNHFDPPRTMIQGIVDERAHYPSETIERAKINGKKLKRYLTDMDVTVGFYGSKAMLMYYSELPIAIECNAGLTDEYIAHLPLEKRGRPGHEKRAPFDYLKKRGVNFIFQTTLPSYTLYDSLRIISFDGAMGYILIYENEVMDQLRHNADVRFIVIPEIIDEYLETYETIPSAYRRADFVFFKNYYFNHNHDPKRFEALVKSLNQSKAEQKGRE